MRLTAKDIAVVVAGVTYGDQNAYISSFGPLDSAAEGSLTFVRNEKYKKQLHESAASIILTPKSYSKDYKGKATLIEVENVPKALATLLQMVMSKELPELVREQPHYIGKRATLRGEQYIGAFSYIGEGATIDKGCYIYPHVYIGSGCSIGEGTIIYSGAKLYRGTVVGKNCIIHSGAVIGSDGFGFAPNGQGGYDKIPQIGKVVIGNRVEIGANTTIDRATFSETTISDGVKLDNLIQVAHNVSIGADTAIAAQAGISGSTAVGARCAIGGQAGIVGHIRIADDVQIAAQSGIARSIEDAESIWMGSPAITAAKAKRAAAVYSNLPEIDKKVAYMEKQLLAFMNTRTNSNER